MDQRMVWIWKNFAHWNFVSVSRRDMTKKAQTKEKKHDP
jgi:hypothetical protein